MVTYVTGSMLKVNVNECFHFVDEIMERIREAGFHIAARQETEVTQQIAEEFYSEHKGKDYFDDLTQHMSR